MRVAYIAPYSGPTLLKQRPIVRNLSLAARVITYVPDDKAETIAVALQRGGTESFLRAHNGARRFTHPRFRGGLKITRQASH